MDRMTLIFILKSVFYVFALSSMIYSSSVTVTMLATGRQLCSSQVSAKDISRLKHEVKRLRERRY